MMRRLVNFIRDFVRRRTLDQDLDVELRFHLESLEAEYRSRGQSPQAARLAARRDFGGVLQTREAYRDQRGVPILETLWRDIRFGIRSMRRTPGMTFAMITTLAIGIGANTAIFALVNGILIRPLSYPGAERLVAVWHSAVFQGMPSDRVDLSAPAYLAYRKYGQTFEEFGIWEDGGTFAAVTGLGEPEQVRVVDGTYGVLRALGVPPLMGRWFSEGDDSPASEETAILTYGYWQRKFGADPSVLGRTLFVDSRPRRIIAVMPRGFRFLERSTDIILPLRLQPTQIRNDVFNYAGVARLKPGVTLEQARRDTARVLQIWGEADGAKPMMDALRLGPALRPLKDDVVGDVGRVLWVLMGTLAIVLLAACANVANLLLVRAQTRQKELGIRAALGAGWVRIARELLIESATLAVAGGALGLALAYGGLNMLVANGPANLPRLQEVSVDPMVVVFTAGLSLGSSLLFGLIPAVKFAGPGTLALVLGALRAGGRTATGSREGHRSQKILVIAQVALALVLLIAAGLMIRTFAALRAVNPGFTDPDHIQLIRISIPPAQVPEPEAVIRMQGEIQNRIAGIPGVASAGFTIGMPMEAEFGNSTSVGVEGITPPGQLPPLRRTKYISPGLLQTQGTAIVAGRDFTWQDVYDRRQVAMVSENMARETWGSAAQAIGKRIRIGPVNGSGIFREVVGVAGDVHENGMDQKAPPMVYWHAGVEGGIPGFPATIRRAVTFAIRTQRAGTESLLTDIRKAVDGANPNLPLAQVRTLADVASSSIARTGFTLVLLGIAGAMALTLGIIGIYGVISHTVSQRTREIGIRIALGAGSRGVRGMFVRQGLGLTAIGLVPGLCGAAALTRWMKSLLFEVSPLDPVTYVAVSGILLTAAAVACYLPSRRATRIAPTDALRAE